MKEEFNVVICSLNSQYIHSSLAPWCLLAGLEEYVHVGINAVVIEGNINETPRNILDRILSHRPALVGFCCYIWSINEVFELVKSLKQELSECIIVLGGPEVSYSAGEVLRSAPSVDYVISGEGEKPFAGLILAIHGNTDVAGIPGLSYREGSQIIVAEPYTPSEIPPSPYSERYLAALNGRIAYLETSRGCPFSCAFCLSGRCGGVRYFDLERAKKELLLLAVSGTQTVKLVDRTFNANRGRAKELFAFIIDRYGKDIPKGVCFHFEIAGELLDEDTIKLLGTAPAGSMQFEIGLQSFNPKTLAAVNRKTDPDKLKKNISALLAKGNIHIHIDLIAGLPYENMPGFADSFNTAFTLRPHMLQLGFLKLLHGSPMRDNPIRFPCEYDSDPPYEVIKTPWLSGEELTLLHHTERALNLLYNRGRFRRTLSYLLGRMTQNAFELFREFGLFLSRESPNPMSLDDLTSLVFSYFSCRSNVDGARLRDCMVCDRLATNASGSIPKALRIRDPRLKAAIWALEREHRPMKAIKRGYALLYTENCLAYTDYKDKNPVTGEYIISKYPFDLKDDIL